MPHSPPAPLVDRLRTLGEFDNGLLRGTATSAYERTVALENGLPSSFVEQRRAELHDRYWKEAAGAILTPLAWPLVLVPNLALEAPPMADLLTVAIVSLATVLTAVTQARHWHRYRTRTLLYDLLADLSDEDAAAPESTVESQSL